MEGAAVAWTASILLDNVATTAALHWRLRLAPFGSGYAVVAVAAVACYGLGGLAFRSVLGTGVGAMAASVLVTSAVYGAVIWRSRTRLRLGAFRALVRSRARGRRPVVAGGT